MQRITRHTLLKGLLRDILKGTLKGILKDLLKESLYRLCQEFFTRLEGKHRLTVT